MADVSVRLAEPGDAAEIGRIQVQTWRIAYDVILPPAVLASVQDGDAAANWLQAIMAPPGPTHRVLVAIEGSWLTGFAALAPATDLQPEDADPAHTAALGPILVEPRWGRRGHGSRLLAAAMSFVRDDSARQVISWAPEQDAVTIGFLTSAGWAPDGLARALDTGAGELREIRLRTSLGEGDR